LFSAFSITIAYRIATSLLQSRLYEDAVQGARREIVAQLPWDRDPSRFGAMLELAVAAPRRDETPTIILQHS
jgi:hypothetical protein